MNLDTYIRTTDLSKLNDNELRRLAGLKLEFERLKRDGGIYGYEPQSYIDNGKEKYQEAFHRSLKKIRWVFGGNKSGKSYCTKAEDVWWLTGKHPHRKVPVPCTGWICSPDFSTSKAVAEKLISQLMPRSLIRHFDRTNSIMTLRNGSEVTFKSYDSDVEKFQGANLDFIDFDEEPPFKVYEECKMRVLQSKGALWCAETPTFGMTWTYDEIFEMAGIDPDIEVFSFGTPWSRYIDKLEIEKTVRGMDEDTKQMRLFGKFIQLSGLVFKKFTKDIHVVPAFKIPSDWTWSRFRMIDHGLNNPTAGLWVAINRDGEHYIYDEYYENEKTIKENAEAIKTISGGERYEWTAIDASTKSRISTNKQTYYDEYKNNGIICRPVYLTAERVSLAINETNDLMHFEIDEKTNVVTVKPKWFVFDTCYATIKEFSRYRWKTYKSHDDKNPPEKPQEFMNHAITAWFFGKLSKMRWISKLEDKPPEVKNWYTARR